MSFICDKCFKVSLPDQPCHRIIVEKRTKDYEQTVIKKGAEDKEYTKVYRSKGWEIAKEQKTCQFCIDAELGLVRIDTRPMRMADEERKPFEPKTLLPYDIQPTYFPWQLGNEAKGMLGRSHK